MDPDLAALLEVQQFDTDVDVLRHKRANLPERAELEACTAALAALEEELTPVRAQRDEITRAQKALEDEIALLADKAAGVEKSMYGGSSSNPRELQAMQEELDALARRRSVLEDRILEAMVEAEPLDAALEEAAARRAALDEQAEALIAKVTEAETAIDAEIDEIIAKREAAAAGVGPDLLDRYEKLRTRLKGVGAALLDGAKCTGCHLTLPAAEVEQVKRQAREERIGVCPECDRLLVVA